MSRDSSFGGLVGIVGYPAAAAEPFLSFLFSFSLRERETDDVVCSLDFGVAIGGVAKRRAGSETTKNGGRRDASSVGDNQSSQAGAFGDETDLI